MNDDIQRQNFLKEIKTPIEEQQIKARLVEVYINGFKWFVDDVKSNIYVDKDLNGKTNYSFLTPNERKQLRDYIDYGKK